MTKVVAFGGGRGLSASLRALVDLAVDLTAVVTVADNGGSSGVIRDTRPVLPPGDIRKALIATASPNRAATADLFGHRFDGEDFLTSHPVGNIVLTSLLERSGNPVEAIEEAAALLGCRARILPMSAEGLDIEAEVRTGEGTVPVRGQHEVAVASGDVGNLRLLPEDACAATETLRAVEDADWHVFGPGSWFTSVIPHFLLPDLRASVARTDAKRVLVLNLSQENETDGLDAAGHLRALTPYSESVRFHYVISPEVRNVSALDSLNRETEALGAELVTAPLASDPVTHDPSALAVVLRKLMAA
ncbi:gluconeogenesis factor YvcK family protein [Salininema proteolyticum]|uniref:Uridine diphosphate-N-acetylglucosamine-binding protein YvcK n=1 Tax=Salininema proteolyticum TaxID=1607685 RepID=A0ABV8U0B7_9ACTN